MDELSGGRHSADSPPPLPEDLLLEILLRLPPEPIYLFRASLVSKHWRGLVHDAGFLRRFREFHGGTPPVLGFFNNQSGPTLFVSTAGAFAASTAAKMPQEDWWVLYCRHGRALLESHRLAKLLVWDLVTGDKSYLPRPAAYEEEEEIWGYAAGHSCPFIVAFVFNC